MIQGYKDPHRPGRTIMTDRKCHVRDFCDFYDEAEYSQSSKCTFVCAGCHEKVATSAFRFVDWATIKASRDSQMSDGWN